MPDLPFCPIGPNYPDSSLGDSPWLLQLSIHPPQQGLVISYELHDGYCRIGVASTGALQLVQPDNTGEVVKEVAITIVCIHAGKGWEKEELD